MARHGKKRKPKKRKPKRLVESRSWEDQYDAELQHRRQDLEQEDTRRRAEHLAQLLRELHAFCKEAGIVVQLSDGKLLVNGARFKLLSGERFKPDAGTIIDRLVAVRFIETLEQSVVAELAEAKQAFTVTRVRHGIRLADEAGDAGMIWGTHALIGDDPMPVRGNFLIGGGDYWETLRTRLRRRSVNELCATFPESASDTAREEAVEASRRIRSDRYRDYHEPVRLNEEGGDASIRLDPVPDREPAQVPFEFTREDSFLRGAIRLNAPNDPLALDIFDRSADESVIAAAWVFALLGYRDLTCPLRSETSALADEETESEGFKDQGERDPATDTSSPRKADRDLVRKLQPSGSPSVNRRSTTLEFDLPASLKPTESTWKALSSYVAGYRRRLPPGQTHQQDSLRRAKLLGIALAKNETWVRPYWRGLVPGAQLVFDWEVPLRFDAYGGLG
jgi:hypothetical protein